jgi:hypothetical protein
MHGAMISALSAVIKNILPEDGKISRQGNHTYVGFTGNGTRGTLFHPVCREISVIPAAV